MSNKKFAFLFCAAVSIFCIVIAAAFYGNKVKTGVYFEVNKIEDSSSINEYITTKNFIILSCTIKNDMNRDIFVKSSDLYVEDKEGKKINLALITHEIKNGIGYKIELKPNERVQFTLIFETEKSTEDNDYFLKTDLFYVGENFPTIFTSESKISLKKK